MKHANAGAVLALFACSAVYGQAADQALQFEVASVKAVPPPVGPNNSSRGCLGGPGSSDPVRYTCANASVSLMAIQAYGLKPYQLRPPARTDTYRFSVEAKVPPGATADQVKVMLRNLLAERFKLAFHYEKTETQAYALVVAKGGLKIKEATPPSPVAPPEGGAAQPKPGPVTDADGFTYFAPRDGMVVGRANGLTRWVGKNVLMEHLAGLSNSLTGQPVIDSTGLKGKYDFIWTFSSDSVGERAPAALPDDGSAAPVDEAGLTIFAALEKQLGLRLEPQKITIDAFVIDHAENTPVEN